MAGKGYPHGNTGGKWLFCNAYCKCCGEKLTDQNIRYRRKHYIPPTCKHCFYKKRRQRKASYGLEYDVMDLNLP